MNITSRNVIYVKKDENGKKHYRARISRKNENGEYENGYIDVRMPKGTELENKTKIEITKGFLSFYNYTDKDNKPHTIWYIVVQEYKPENVEVNVVHSITQEELDDLPLPF